MIIRFYTLQLLKTLEVLNLSNSSIADMTFYPGKKVKNYTLLGNVKVLNISFCPIPKLATKIPPTITNCDFLKTDAPNVLYIMKQFLSCQAINVTGILNRSRKTVKLKKCTVSVTVQLPWLVQEIIGRKNNLNRLDAQFHCENYAAYSIKRFDVAENDLEFLHPSIVSCVPNIEILDLSNNLMHKMVDENVSLFEKLFISLQHLKSISLSANKLRFIPRKLFENNLELLSVDLSVYFISQVTFTVDKLNHLKVLDLRSNIIKILDKESITMLDLIHIEQNKTMAIVKLNNNPICCSKCMAELFLEWLTKTNIVDKTNLKCVDENFILVNVTDNGFHLVRNICRRRKIMIVSLASAGAVSLLAILTCTITYKRRKQILQKRRRESIIRLLRNGKGSFKFVAFLHFSSDDEEFVQLHIENELNNKLRDLVRLTGLERELICSEHNARPGHSLLLEIADFVENSSFLVIVLSEAYCSSSYYTRYLEYITTLLKPIVLMIKEQINQKQMNAMISLTYEQAALRIQWERINEEYVLKTTWDHVCSSIIDLIVEKNMK